MGLTVDMILRCINTSNCHVLYSSPCTGGCSFNVGINKFRGSLSFQKKLQWYWIMSSKMWRNFKVVAARVASVQGSITIEWAHRCMYHRLAETRSLVHKYDMSYHPVSGCSVGLRSIVSKTRGKLLCKQWGFWTNNTNLRSTLMTQRFRCNKKHQTIPTEGKDTANTGNYTNQLAKILHKAYHQS